MMATRQNHLAKVEMMRENMRAAGLMRERFPKVSGIVIHMTYYQRAPGSVLMERTVNFYPSGYAYFNMRCMARGCEDGGFDLAPVIRGLVKKGQRSAKGYLPCRGAGDGHASIAYRIDVSYCRKSAHRLSPAHI
ncbi:MAG: hypothetical protein M0Z48_09840 [Nitrospiraceae bacterium]|nr:hypothetical protein [Nitrospiraceae bacterium]